MRHWLIFVFLFGLLSGAAFGKQLRVAIIDTGLDLGDPRFQKVLCPYGHRDFVGRNAKDENGHGTHIAGLIKQYAVNTDYCLMILKYYSISLPDEINSQNSANALEYAATQNVDIVNYSGGGPTFNTKEYMTIKNHPDILFVVSAGNGHRDLDVPDPTGKSENAFYPAMYDLPNVIVVGAIDREGQKISMSNFGKRVNFWELGEDIDSDWPGENHHKRMTGTSQATAIVTGKIISGQLPWPIEKGCAKLRCPFPKKSLK